MKRKEEEIRNFIKKNSLKKGIRQKGSIGDNIGDLDDVDLGFKVFGVMFKLKLNREDDFEVDIRSLLRIRQSQMFSDIEQIPLQLGQFGILLAKARTNLKKREMELDEMYSQLFRSLRANEEYKKYTDTSIKKLVEGKEKYIEIKKQIEKDEEKIECLNQIYWAMVSKKEISLELMKSNNI